MLRVYNYIQPRGVTMIGPNCPGALSPGKANVGIIPAEIFSEGSIGLVSRSGTLTYQIGHELTGLGLGNSTIVGIGGDPVVGSSFIDVLAKFEADAETELVVMVGEIGGDEEEKAARFIAAEMSKPVVAYIAGFSAPPGKTMGHAGAIITGSSGTAQAKKEALEASGVRVGTSPTEAAQIAAEVARGLAAGLPATQPGGRRFGSRRANRHSYDAPGPGMLAAGERGATPTQGGGYARRLPRIEPARARPSQFAISANSGTSASGLLPWCAGVRALLVALVEVGEDLVVASRRHARRRPAPGSSRLRPLCASARAPSGSAGTWWATKSRPSSVSRCRTRWECGHHSAW